MELPHSPKIILAWSILPLTQSWVVAFNMTLQNKGQAISEMQESVQVLGWLMVCFSFYVCLSLLIFKSRSEDPVMGIDCMLNCPSCWFYTLRQHSIIHFFVWSIMKRLFPLSWYCVFIESSIPQLTWIIIN